MINTKKNRHNLYTELGKLDIISRIRPLLDRQGYIVRPGDDKIVPRSMVVSHETPWVYVQTDPEARCDVFHRVFYNILDHIPTYCRNCWKVVVRPKTLVQLFDLYEIQKEMGVPCKCGIERRDSVHGLYGGYFYTRSKEEGQKRYEEVRSLVDTYIDPDTTVLLKRYCTEFELGGHMGVKGQGDSSEMPDTTQEEKAMEDYILAHFPKVGYSSQPSKHLIATVMNRWIHYAYKHGDESYKAFTGGESLFPSYTTYHEKGD